MKKNSLKIKKNVKARPQKQYEENKRCWRRREEEQEVEKGDILEGKNDGTQKKTG